MRLLGIPPKLIETSATALGGTTGNEMIMIMMTMMMTASIAATPRVPRRAHLEQVSALPRKRGYFLRSLASVYPKKQMLP